MAYTIDEHKFRFSAWAASRAASTSKLCRFEVKQGQKCLRSIKNIEIPNNQKKFDILHQRLRKKIISEAAKFNKEFSHGVAAKLINVYFKSMIICDNKMSKKIQSIIHPPIDSILLKTLYENNIGGLGKEFKKIDKIKWSKLNSEQYEECIKYIKIIMKNKPLWMIEEYWVGHQ